MVLLTAPNKLLNQRSAWEFIQGLYGTLCSSRTRRSFNMLSQLSEPFSDLNTGSLSDLKTLKGRSCWEMESVALTVFTTSRAALTTSDLKARSLI